METQQKPRVYYEEAYPPVPLGFVKFMRSCTIWQLYRFFVALVGEHATFDAVL